MGIRDLLATLGWAFSAMFSLVIAIIFFVIVMWGFWFIQSLNTPSFPWAAVFCFSLAGVVLAIYFWTKPKAYKIEKALSPNEQAYKEWWDSKINPEIIDFYKIKDKN